MYPIYVVARSPASFRMFIKRNSLDANNFRYLIDSKEIHRIKSGSLFVFLEGCEKRTDYKAIRDTVKLRTDLVRLKEW